MTWIIVASSLLAGVIIGLLIGGRLSAQPTRVRGLEAELREAADAERRQCQRSFQHDGRPCPPHDRKLQRGL